MLNLKLNPIGNLTLSINGEAVDLTAEELDEQIAALSSLRAQMPQEVPEEPSPIQEVMVNPLYAIRVDRLTKTCLLRIRHAGLGWMNFEIPPQEVLNMKDVWTAIAKKLEIEPQGDAESIPDVPTNLH